MFFTSRPISCWATIIFLKVFSIFVFFLHYILFSHLCNLGNENLCTAIDLTWARISMSDANFFDKRIFINMQMSNLHLGIDKWFCFVLCFSKTAIKMSSASSLCWWELWVNLKSRNMASCLANTWLTLLIFSSSPLTSATGVCVHSHT